MPRYEYMVELVLIESGLQEYLNAMGEKGYRLVAVERIPIVSAEKGMERYTEMIFEREREE